MSIYGTFLEEVLREMKILLTFTVMFALLNFTEASMDGDSEVDLTMG